jgi:hypothetical protein
MTLRIAVIALGIVAVMLIVLGATWKWFHPPESYWSKEQAQALVDAFGAVHAAEDAGPHGPNDPGGVAFMAARRHYDAVQNELEQARTARDLAGRYLAIAGFVLLLVVYSLWRFSPPAEEKGG